MAPCAKSFPCKKIHKVISKICKRKIQGSATFYPEIQKILPFITDLDVRLTPESLKILPFHLNVKKLRFEITSSRDMNGEELLLKNKALLSRSLANMKGVKSMTMMINDTEAKSAIFLLERIDQNLFLDSLERFNLHFFPGLFSKGSQKLPVQKADLSKVLAKLTFLNTESSDWYSFLLSSGKLNNLSALHLKLASEQISLDLKDLLLFENLPKLKKLTLKLTAHSEPLERNFFENFSLPSSLEDLNLTLTGFRLSLVNDNDDLSYQFFKRLEEKAKGVKAFSLDVIENAVNLARISKFYCLFVKCFDRLGTLQCKNTKEKSLYRKNPPETEGKPLDFQDFWTALIPSKETLQTISINFNDIAFPEEAHILETGFPKLQKLWLRENLLSPSEFGKFCNKIPNLTDIIIQKMRFSDEKKLSKFLDDMKEIPKGRGFELYLNVGDIGQESLIGCLRKFIKDVKVKGRLGMYFYDVEVENVKDYDEIFRMVKEKGCFQAFEINTRNFW